MKCARIYVCIYMCIYIYMCVCVREGETERESAGELTKDIHAQGHRDTETHRCIPIRVSKLQWNTGPGFPFSLLCARAPLGAGGGEG